MSSKMNLRVMKCSQDYKEASIKYEQHLFWNICYYSCLKGNN